MGDKEKSENTMLQNRKPMEIFESQKDKLRSQSNKCSMGDQKKFEDKTLLNRELVKILKDLSEMLSFFVFTTSLLQCFMIFDVFISHGIKSQKSIEIVELCLTI